MSISKAKLMVAGVTTTMALLGGSMTVSHADKLEKEEFKDIEYTGHSIVDFLDLAGKDYSFDNREKLADSLGIENYEGKAKQNLEILSELTGNEELKKVSIQEVEKKVSTSKVEKEQKVKQATENKVEGKTLTLEATAYTAYCNGCSGVTRTGQDLRANPNQKVVAVDPNVIPLGSKVHVEGYGVALAGDTGGAIKGNRIDLFMPSQSEAVKFGRKSVKVTIIN